MDLFRKRHGIPIGFWSLGENREDIIRFDSPCMQHKKGQAVHLAEAMMKDFKKLKKNKHYLLDTAHLLENGRIKTYLTPRGTIPLFLVREGLIFIQENGGHYYFLKVDLEGEMRIVDNKQSFENSRKISCPTKLINHFNRSKRQDFYRGYFCHALWNRDTKKTRAMLFSFACE